MGVTYKAFDVDLRGPVTIKVSSEKYLGDEAELRFFAGCELSSFKLHSPDSI